MPEKWSLRVSVQGQAWVSQLCLMEAHIQRQGPHLPQTARPSLSLLGWFFWKSLGFHSLSTFECGDVDRVLLLAKREAARWPFICPAPSCVSSKPFIVSLPLATLALLIVTRDVELPLFFFFLNKECIQVKLLVWNRELVDHCCYCINGKYSSIIIRNRVPNKHMSFIVTIFQLQGMILFQLMMALW